MDASRFDELAKVLAAGVSRRQVLKAFAAGAAPGLLAALGLTRPLGVDAEPIQPAAGTKPEAVPDDEFIYIALGDSIASGHGLDDPKRGEDGPTCGERCCRRAAKAYPHRVRQEIESRFKKKISFTHLACTGARATPVTPAPHQKLKLLENQVEQARILILNGRLQQPVLVSMTIGANDFEFSNPMNFLLRLYAELHEEPYDTWVEETAASIRNTVETQGDLLLEYPNVRLVVTEVPNPFNRESAFFLSADDVLRFATGVGLPLASDRCAGVACYSRIERATKLLNQALKDAVRDLEQNYPGRVAITEGLHDAFLPHASPRGELAFRLFGSPWQTPVYQRECCGQAEPDIADTWIQYRYDKASTSRPDLGKAALVLGSEEWRGDCVHPNAEGARQIALRVVKAALPMLGPRIKTQPAVSEVTSTSAVITWTTDQPTNGHVEYGQTRHYGRQRPREQTNETSEHRVELDHLEPGRTYHYRVVSTNVVGEVTSDDQTFTTEATCADIGTACANDTDCCTADNLACWNGHCVRICRTDDECAVDDPCVGFYCGPRGRCLYVDQPSCEPASGALPDQFIGSWTGTGEQTGPTMEWPITVTFSEGTIGSTSGTAQYSTLGCTSTLTLTRVLPTGDQIELTEAIDTGKGSCVDGGTFVFTLAPDGTIDFSWTSPNGASFAHGSLAPVGNSAATGRMRITAMTCSSPPLASPVTETTVSAVPQFTNVDPFGCTAASAPVNVTITDAAGGTTSYEVIGTLEFDVPFGAYTVTEDASGASTTFDLAPRTGDLDFCPGYAGCAWVFVTLADTSPVGNQCPPSGGGECGPYVGGDGPRNYCFCSTSVNGSGICIFTFGTNSQCRHQVPCASDGDCETGRACVTTDWCDGTPLCFLTCGAAGTL